MNELIQEFSRPTTYFGPTHTIQVRHNKIDYSFEMQQLLGCDALKDVFRVSCYKGQHGFPSPLLFTRSYLEQMLGKKFIAIFAQSKDTV